MLTLPRRQTLATQTAAILREQIANGAWNGVLPGERRLCELLQVSRNTVRSAIAELRRARLIEARVGIGHRLVAADRPDGRLASAEPSNGGRSRDVAFLSPVPIEELQPRQALCVNELRGLLGERGYRLHVFHGAQYYQSRPDAALRRLVEANPHGCWIVSLANERVQQWFQRHRVPAVLASSPHEGVELPFSDLDHRAICRHAVGVLTRLGHTRIALFAFKTRRAGEFASVRGFDEGVRMTLQQEPMVIYHDETRSGIEHRLNGLLAGRSPPTALLVNGAYYFVAVASRLAQMGLRIPGDISVISRDDGAFLNLYRPTPARYTASPNAMAKNLWRPVSEVLGGGFGAGRGRFIMPEFIRGESIAPPPRSA